MAKLTLANISSGYNTTIQLNSNNDLIEAALENTLSRDGTTPNTMGVNLDMNNYKVINLAAPTNANDGARLTDVQSSIAGGNALLMPFTPYGNISSTNVQNAIQEEIDDLGAVGGAALIGNNPSGTISAITVQAALNEIVSDNAASSGSSLIGFIHSGTGAVVRTIQDKNRESVTVTDFGADSTGSSDSRAAFALANTNGPFIIPRGTYKISSNITLTNLVQFDPAALLSIDTGVVVTFAGVISSASTSIFIGLGTVVLSKNQIVFPEWWGAGSGVASAVAINKMIVACTTNLPTVYFSGAYLLETNLVVPSNLPILSSASSSFTPTGGATTAVVVNTGNGCRQIYPKILSFTAAALQLKGVSLGDIYVPEVTGCGTVVSLETVNATHPNALDNKITVQVMSTNTNGFVIQADNSANIMQGNEFYCNFATSTLRTVFYNGSGLSPNWDSNLFVFQAIDPTPALGANTRGLYSNAVSVSRCTFKVESWFGGFASTSKYIDGVFNGSNFYFSLAEAPANYAMSALTGIGNTFDTRYEQGKTSTYVAAANTTGSIATFNGGLPLWGNLEKIRVTIAGANVLSGGSYSCFIYHFKTDGASNKFSFIPLDMKGMAVMGTFDNGSNEIYISLMNLSGATINIGTTIDFYFRIGT